MQFVVKTTDAFGALDRATRSFLMEANRSGLFLYLDTDLKVDQPMSTVVIDRDKAALLGLQMSDIGGAMAAMLGGGYVNYFDLDGRSYRVIPQVEQRFRLNVDQVLGYYIRAADGAITAALYLQAFVPDDVPWAHFDMMAWNNSSRPGRPEGGEAQAARAIFRTIENRLKR